MRAPKLTRRSFFKTAAAGGVIAAAVGVLPGCTHGPDEIDADPTVVDEDSAESVLESFTQADSPLAEEHSWTLPLGNVLRPAEGAWAPVITAGSSATPMVKASALSLSSGTLAEVVPAPLGTAATTVIYDVRCSDSVYAWVELDLVTRAWALYASAFSDGQLSGDTKMLWEGAADYDPAPFAVSGSSHLGDSDAQSVVESPGRFATAPTVSAGTVVLAPRVHDDEGVFYGVTAYALSDDLKTKVDQLVMPASVRPFRAARVGERFLVSVEASYSSGGLLSKMGTYMGTSSAGFVKLDREPSECGCGKDDLFVIKSNSSYLVINLADKTYSSLASVDRAVDYGEFPARAGECDQFVTFSTVKDPDTGYPASVTVRTFRL